MEKTEAHGIQLEVESYEVCIAPTKEGIIAYLSSGQIKGVGKGFAERIFNVFGLDTLMILDRDPKQLLTVPGIQEKRLKKICKSYIETRGARNVITFLAPHGISTNMAVKLYEQYGADTMDVIRNHPYQLCEMKGIAFFTADSIAMRMGLNRISAERVDEALLCALDEAEELGHSCLEKNIFLKNTMKLLDTPEITRQMIVNRAARLIHDERLATFEDSVFLSRAAQTESSLASAIALKLQEIPPVYNQLDDTIAQEEQKLRFRLAPEQKAAIKMALTNKICIITGGPGTGKTSVQRALLGIYRARYPDAKIVCCAPTGIASRRMTQSTGMPSCTVHKVLNVVSDDEDREPEVLNADLVLVDEISMLDVYLAKNLFQAIQHGSCIILVGDSEQLPSVGPGAVLKEMIASGKVPVSRLDRVFRQKEGSRIAANAKLIRHGNLSLEYGPDFQFFDSANIKTSAEIIETLYLEEVSKYGVENVILLTPFRKNTETRVNM